MILVLSYQIGLEKLFKMTLINNIGKLVFASEFLIIYLSIMILRFLLWSLVTSVQVDEYFFGA